MDALDDAESYVRSAKRTLERLDADAVAPTVAISAWTKRPWPSIMEAMYHGLGMTERRYGLSSPEATQVREFIKELEDL